jgi:hypothetical protein
MFSLNTDEKKKLSSIVDEVAGMLSGIKDTQEQIKELCVAAAEKCNVQAKVVKHLAKEKNFNEEERLKQRQYEEEVDSCRVALGLLADTPLGEHAQATTCKKAKTKKPMHAAAYA